MKLARNRKHLRVEMLPLMDIVFLLLVFFIYAMLSMALHRALPLSLPKSSVAQIEREVGLALTIMADGGLYLDKEPVSLDSLAETLRAKAGLLETTARGRDMAESEREEPFVQVFAADSLSYQDLYRVLDQVKLSGLRKVTLQAGGREISADDAGSRQ